MNICRKAVLIFWVFFVAACGAKEEARSTATPALLPSATIAPSLTPPPSPTPIPLRGLAYSPYRDCQSPDSEFQPSLENIREDLKQIAAMANGVRTYSGTGINAEIPKLAAEMGLRVSAGAWLGRDKAANEEEIEGLIEIAKSVPLEAVIVGNEVLLRNDMTEDELIAYIERVKDAVDVPVTTAEIGGILLNHPRVMDAVDFQMVHLYAYWDGIPIENAARAVLEDYRKIQAAAGGKRVVIGETGWPSAGPGWGEAATSPENQHRFAREFLSLAVQEGVEYFYFDIFDEMWKGEGGVGPYWGLFYADRTPKYADITSVMEDFGETSAPFSSEISSAAPTAISSQANAAGSQDAFHIYIDRFSEENHFAPGGWMGDYENLGMDACFTEGEEWSRSVIEIAYSAEPRGDLGWGGMYWLQPDGNWGTRPNAGFDLSAYNELVFSARADAPNTQISFFAGGVAKDENGDLLPYPSSIQAPVYATEADEDGFVLLNETWQEYHINLVGKDLSYVIDGFGWVGERERTPETVIFYLDNIRFVKNENLKAPPLAIYAGETLGKGFDMGVSSSGQRYDWVKDIGGTMQVAYPDWHFWGVVYITVGKPTSQSLRDSMDLSAYSTLSVEMRGVGGGEEVYIGVKDRFQPDDGSERLIPVILTNEWATYTFPLTDFTGVDLSEIYMPIEFVFRGSDGATIFFRNIEYLP